MRKRNANKVIVAVPVASPRVIPEFRKLADEVYCISTPIQFNAVGQFFDDFSQTSDSAVVEIMERSRTPKQHIAV